jgi:prepilin-type N-terminal cleavage/methylation domain-containing protein
MVPTRHTTRGFTLTEMLVVIVIVVLILGMAMPVFRFITGSRSEEGASNQIAAMLGRARADALGLQLPVGVLFHMSAEGQSERMALVDFAPCPDWSSGQAYQLGDCVKQSGTGITPAGAVLYFICTSTTPISGPGSKPPTSQSDAPGWRWVGGPPLELRADTDTELLPAGVGVQTVCNGGVNGAGTARTTDGYLSTGVIMFDINGRLTTQTYAIPDIGPLADALGLNGTSLQHAGYPSRTNIFLPGSAPPRLGTTSQFGLVLFQRESFISQQFTVDDVITTVANAPPQPSTTAAWQSAYGSSASGPSEAQEESWLDLNAAPLLINRYNGTLVKGE